MGIYIQGETVETVEKVPEQATVIQAVTEKTYTQEEVLAMLAEAQKGE